VKRVDSWHITRGYARNQLSKIVYFTSKDRIVSCYYNRVRYSTKRFNFKVPTGSYLQYVKQYQDKRKCCGRVTGIVHDKFAVDYETALNTQRAATCKKNQFVMLGKDGYRTCKDCPKGKNRDEEDPFKCSLSCVDYQFLNDEGTKCVADKCSIYE
jgi:hypothetical protein